MKIVDQGFTCLTKEEEYKDYTKRLEQIGRVCYKSEHKISTDSETLFIRRIMQNGHEAILEHCSLTFHFVLDRATANALVRHRTGTAFAQESTHFINYAKKYDELTFIRPICKQEAAKVIEASYQFFEDWYFCEAEDIAHQYKRTMLPLGFKTELMMTANLREWRHILKLRAHSSAHPQMRALMRELLKWFIKELPLYVEDIGGSDFGY